MLRVIFDALDDNLDGVLEWSEFEDCGPWAAQKALFNYNSTLVTVQEMCDVLQLLVGEGNNGIGPFEL